MDGNGGQVGDGAGGVGDGDTVAVNLKGLEGRMFLSKSMSQGEQHEARKLVGFRVTGGAASLQ